MKRYDLRAYAKNYEARLFEILRGAKKNEVVIFIVETTNDEVLKAVIEKAREQEYEVMNSVRFNELDWTLVIKAGLVK